MIHKSIRVLATIAVIGLATTTVSTSSFAQAKEASTTQDVSKWTQKQWDAAKAKWVKEKEKWSSCNAQATKQKLSGRNSWSFLYTCMTK